MNLRIGSEGKNQALWLNDLAKHYGSRKCIWLGYCAWQMTAKPTLSSQIDTLTDHVVQTCDRAARGGS